MGDHELRAHLARAGRAHRGRASGLAPESRARVWRAIDAGRSPCSSRLMSPLRGRLTRGFTLGVGASMAAGLAFAGAAATSGNWPFDEQQVEPPPSARIAAPPKPRSDPSADEAGEEVARLEAEAPRIRRSVPRHEPSPSQEPGRVRPHRRGAPAPEARSESEPEPTDAPPHRWPEPERPTPAGPSGPSRHAAPAGATVPSRPAARSPRDPTPKPHAPRPEPVRARTETPPDESSRAVIRFLPADGSAPPSRPTPFMIVAAADRARRAGRLARALRLYRRLASRSDAAALREESLYRWASCAIELGRYDEARLALSRAAALPNGTLGPELAALEVLLRRRDEGKDH